MLVSSSREVWCRPGTGEKESVMKKWLIVMAMVWVFLPQAPGAHVGGLASRWDTKDLDNTWGLGGVLRTDLDRNLQLDIRGAYFKFTHTVGGVKSTAEIFPIEAALLWTFPLDHQFTLYAGGGGGYYLADGKFNYRGHTIDVALDDEFGYFALGGAEVRVGKSLRLFGELKRIWFKLEPATYPDADRPGGRAMLFDDDVNMNGLAINIGLLFRF